ncbi:MAG: hypothetical protein M1503_05265 [Thaumarchaeota archaeon]|nr:hypothetical protein [Nitrososphaerota archaeon]MCL5317660.1 hypothetical protein [Nitrososphaerota archaeon]
MSPQDTESLEKYVKSSLEKMQRALDEHIEMTQQHFDDLDADVEDLELSLKSLIEAREEDDSALLEFKNYFARNLDIHSMLKEVKKQINTDDGKLMYLILTWYLFRHQKRSQNGGGNTPDH